MGRNRLRVWCVVALGVTVFLGFFSRGHRIGVFVWDKSLGDALSALAAYLGILIFRPGWQPWVVFLWAAVFCAGIETFKLTGLPAAWVSHAASRLILGTTPSVHNLVCYLVGILAGAGLHWFCLQGGNRASGASL